VDEKQILTKNQPCTMKKYRNSNACEYCTPKYDKIIWDQVFNANLLAQGAGVTRRRLVRIKSPFQKSLYLAHSARLLLWCSTKCTAGIPHLKNKRNVFLDCYTIKNKKLKNSVNIKILNKKLVTVSIKT